MMNLTREQQSLLDGEGGETLSKALEILVALGKIYGAPEMIPIASAQVSGVSYKNLGDAGLEFLEKFSGDARVKVLTTLNPAGMDLENWGKMGVSQEFATKQKKLIEIFAKLGIAPTCSCTPYLIGNLPSFGEHLAWAESSAVSYANSVLGARTNRESGISALCSALTGVTPKYGLHLDDNRQAHFLVEVDCALKTDSDFGALGYLLGKEVRDRVPYITGINSASPTNLKALGAAMAASGAVALYHVEGITPEAQKTGMLAENPEKMRVESLKEAYDNLNSTVSEIDLVAVGCPHASLEELKRIAQLLEKKEVTSELWVLTSRKIKELADSKGLTERIERSGAKVIVDTCMVVAPLEELGFASVATNSGKAAFYLPSYCQAATRFGSLEKCISAAVTGKWN